MPLEEITLDGVKNKVSIAIDRLRAFEPSEGYYLAFSGGKDSQCIYHLAEEAGVKFTAHYSVTTVDPPELVRFISKNYKNVIFEKPEFPMRKLIPKKLTPPFRRSRYCCEVLKEGNGAGRICVTGVRWAESSSRKENHGVAETFTKNKKDKMLFSDNDEGRLMFENCTVKGKRLVNPIIDWGIDDVWEYIHSNNIKYCELYDQGHNRLGCVGCPMASEDMRIKEFIRWPQYKGMYINAFDKMLFERKRKGLTTGENWRTGEAVFDWWMHEENRKKKAKKLKIIEGQICLEGVQE